MSGERGPSLRARWLGKLLREHRELAGLRLTEAGEHIQRSQATMSRMEAGLVPARPPDVLALLDLYDVREPTIRDGMEQLSRDVFRKGWWSDYTDHVAHWLVEYAWLEERASGIRYFNALVPPGLLQTRDYAEAIIRAVDFHESDDHVRHWTDFRLARQRVLTEERPLRVECVLDEAVLRRTVGGRAVMHGQLSHLAEVSERPNVDLRILPFHLGAHAGHRGEFAVVDMPKPFSTVVYTGALADVMYAGADEVERFSTAYDALRDGALGLEESADLLRTTAKECT